MVSLQARLLAALLGTCATPQAVVRSHAATDLACDERNRSVEVSCHGGIVFHLAEQFRCEARGCGNVAKYECETPFQLIGAIELPSAAICGPANAKLGY